MSARQLLRYAVQRIPAQPAVPKEIIFIDKLPLTAVGKPIKHLLQAVAARRVFNVALPVTPGQNCGPGTDENGAQRPND